MQVGTVLKSHVLASTDDDGIVDRLMGLAGRTAVEAKRIVQQGSIIFLNRIQPLDEVRVHLV